MKTFLISIVASMVAITALADDLVVAANVDNSFGIERANVWVDNGFSAKTYHLDSWSQGAAYEDGVIKVGSTVVTSSSLESVGVLVNAVESSYPAISSPLPKISLVGLDTVSSSLGELLDSATVSIIPNGGVFDETVALKLVVMGGIGQTQTVEYRIDNQAVVQKELTITEGSNEIELFLSRQGSHIVEYKLLEDTEYKSALFTITNQDNKRDSDGDGIPDIVEVELGSNPLAVDSSSGWSKFDIYLRGDDIVDSDGDGWSDFDERELRETAYDDNLSKPTAASLYGVEYLVTTRAKRDDNNVSMIERVSMVTIESQILYDSKQFEMIEPLADSYNHAVSSTVGSELRALLDSGVTPLVRVPAALPIIERVREDNSSNAWVEKVFIPSAEDLSVVNFYKTFQADASITDVNLSSFSTAYLEYLKENLVVEKSVLADEKSTLLVAAMELAMKSRSSSDTLVLLGDTDRRYDYSAYQNTLKSLQESQRVWNDLYSDLESLFLSYSLEVEDMSALRADTNTTDIQLALYMQKELPLEQQYKVALLSIVPFSQADQQAQQFAENSVFVADAESDGDSILNKDEVLKVVYSNPLKADSDSDGLDDANDPCLLDSTNSCLSDKVASQDVDGDGIVDSVDNCPLDANEDQVDSDGDGIGDLCAQKGIVFVDPKTNIALFEGENYTLKVQRTEASSADIVWEFNGQRALNPTASYNYIFDEVGITTVCVSLEGDETSKSCIDIEVKQAPSVTVVPSLYAAAKLEGDSDYSNLLVEVALSAAAPEELHYTYTTQDYIATAGEDYIQTAGELLFERGEVRQYVSVAIKGDREFETDESFDFLLMAEGETQALTSLRVTILNDDASVDDNDDDIIIDEDNNISSFVYFALSESVYGNEPWMSDGSSGNSTLLKDLVPGSDGSYPREFVKTADAHYLYFTAYNVDDNRTLYRSEGTAETTISLGEIEGFEASDFVEINGVIYYVVIVDNGAKLYKIDGETQVYLADISSGYMSADGDKMLYNIGTDLFFITNLDSESESNRDLYKYNTVTNELSLVKDIYPDEEYYDISNIITSDTMIYFTVNSKEIWQSDGSESGTYAIVTIGDEEDYIGYSRYLDGYIYYVVVDGDTSENRLYVYNLNDNSTTELVTYTDAYVGAMYVTTQTLYMQLDSSSEHKLLAVTPTTLTEVFSSAEYILEFDSLAEHFIGVTTGVEIFNENGDILLTLTNKESVYIIQDRLPNQLFFEVFDYESGSVTLYVTDFTAAGTKALVTRDLEQ